MHLLIYRIFSCLASPFIGLWLKRRIKRGKEDPARLPERLGLAGKPRPEGKLLWLHAASVGESVSILPLLAQLRERHPQTHLLVTTGTVTSARLMAERLPAGVIHQFAPVDTAAAARRFLKHWRPDVTVFVESELWPNLVLGAHATGSTMLLLNGRMSPRSFARWKKRGTMARTMLRCFSLCLAQSEGDGERFRELGAANVTCPGNLKYDAPALPDNAPEREKLAQEIAGRKMWLASSTHPGEEEQVAEAHRELLKHYPDLLLISVPRHPNRGPELKALFSAEFRVALRSAGESITSQTQVYVANTIGELGLFYRLSPIVFMGGSLVKHGGQNPLEPARLDCAIVTGPHTHNFPIVYEELREAGAVVTIDSGQALAAQVGAWLNDEQTRKQAADNALGFMNRASGVVERYMQAMTEYVK